MLVSFCQLVARSALPSCLVMLLATAGGSIASDRDTPSPAVAELNASAGAPLFSDHYATVDGARLHYVEGGSGELVVFLHGFPSFWYMWKPQLLALVGEHRVVALDALGANLSARPTDLDAYRVERLAAQLHALATRLSDGERFTLVGHDWGGALSWAYAQRYPESLHRLVVLSAPPYNLFLELLRGDGEQRAASAYMERLKETATGPGFSTEQAAGVAQMAYGKLAAAGKLTAEDVELFTAALTTPGALTAGARWYAANVPTADAIDDGDYWPGRNTATSVPSMLIWGADDRTFVPAFRERLPAYAPGVRIEVLDNVGHWPGLREPERVNALLREFLH